MPFFCAHSWHAGPRASLNAPLNMRLPPQNTQNPAARKTLRKFLRAYSGASLTYFLQCAVACNCLCELPCWPRAKPPLNLLGGGARLRCDPIYGYALAVFLAGSLLAVKTDDSGFTRRQINPGKRLRGRVGLIAVLSVGKVMSS